MISALQSATPPLGNAAAVGRQVLRLALLLLLASPTAARAATLAIELSGVENDHGLVRAAICTSETFLTKHCPFAGEVLARAGSVTVRISDIPPSRYAVQAYHDEDGNGRVRHGLFGIPSEAIGFSRDAPLRLGPPRFEDAAIDVAERRTATRLKLRHVGP